MEGKVRDRRTSPFFVRVLDGESMSEARDKGGVGSIWLLSFLHYDLGYIDREQRTLRTIDNPFATRMSPMS